MDVGQVEAALRRLAGTQRVLLYDVPESAAPSRSNSTSPFVHGGNAWWDFVNRRRALDTGEDLNLLISLRGLRFDERLIVVDWGTQFANAFLLVEPADPWLDLSGPDGVEQCARSSNAANADILVRHAYAEWIYWIRDEEGQLESRAATMDISDSNATLWQSIWDRLPDTFPASRFLSSLTLLNLQESELFTGGREVRRSLVPFLTRLGLPVLYDAHHVISGVRELVNAGLALVQDPQDNWRSYHGPADPLPPDLPDEQIALMVR
jgi:hypothetical protein